MAKETRVNNRKKSKLIVSIILWSLATVLVVSTIFAPQLWGNEFLLSKVFDDPEGGFQMMGAWVVQQLPVVIRSVIYMIIVFAISKIIRWIISKFLSVSKRGRTASKLIDSFLKYFTALVVIIVVLLIFGVDPVALFASVGILGLIVGLGAQSLISDIISGLFIIFEHEYEVGDYIVIDGFRGKVESIGIRTTQLVDGGGNNKIVNNSDVTGVVNLSYDVSIVAVEVAVPYDDYKKAEQLFLDHEAKLKEQFPTFTLGPKYIGPVSFGNDGVMVKIIGKVAEESRFQAERDLRRAVLLLLAENHIEIPFETVNINNVTK